MNQRTLSRIICMAALSAFTAPAQTTYTYPELVRRLTDMRELAKLPPAGEKTSLASSYDRRSAYDAATDKYTGWDANGDGGGIVRQEGDISVLAEIQGPGCIWRTWSATASATGHVKVYLDGAAAPAIDLPFKSYFDGTAAPFNRPNLVYTPSERAHGLDNYTPICFQKSSKIVGQKGWGSYYQFTYTQFPPGTIVPTFRMDLSSADAAALDHADKILGECGENPAGWSRDAEIVNSAITAKPGAATTVAELKGPGAISVLKVKLDLPADPEAQRILLRQLTVSIRWDDDPTSAVWSPLGDFFGYVGGADKFRSLPVGLLDDGTFYSYWYMPYGKRAHIEVGNDGPRAIAMTWQIGHEPLGGPISQFGRFHAKWHRDASVPGRADRAPDWALLNTRGRGRFVGTHLHGWNPRGDWWGEGDDKFFVDGEKFPSSFGTGSEDYFGYAWSSAAHFSRPYHNQILNEGNAGHFDDNRWHISDSIPFQISFEGVIEKYFPNDRPTLYAAEVFWYQDQNGSDPYGPVPVADRAGYWVRPNIYREPNSIEAESLRVITQGVRINRQEMHQFGEGWSNGHHLLWSPQNISGETLELELPPQRPGMYRLSARFTKGPDFGTFQLAVDGAAAGQPVDLYAPKVMFGDTIDLGTITLAGRNPRLQIDLKGKNPGSAGVNFGLDFLKLVPVQ
jgi:hypothetical protein